MSAGYKTFTVSHDWSGWKATLRILQDEETTETMREMLLFWSGGPDRIEDAEGDITEAWLVMFAERAFTLSWDAGLPCIKRSFEQAEGWAPLDGSCGIELLSCDDLETDSTEFTTKTIEPTTDKECASC